MMEAVAMKEKIRSHVEQLFVNAPKTGRAYELKEELIANLVDRFEDLTSQGRDEQQAYNIVIAGIGDVDELIRGLSNESQTNSENIERRRQKSAILTSSAIGIYIISIIFPIIFESVAGVVMMFICWATATMLLVYNSMSKPKYVKKDETLVEEFKEWKNKKSKKNALESSMIKLVWATATITFFIFGFFFNAFSPGWLVFILAAVISQIIKLSFAYKGGE